MQQCWSAQVRGAEGPARAQLDHTPVQHSPQCDTAATRQTYLLGSIIPLHHSQRRLLCDLAPLRVRRTARHVACLRNRV